MSEGITLIIGGTGAIGTTVTHRLFDEGHRVVIAGRNSEAGDSLIENLRSKDSQKFAPEFVQVDISQDASVSALVTHVKQMNTKIRMLVFLPAAPTDGGIDTASITAILEAVNVKVGGLLRMVRALDPLFTEGSAIVVIDGNLAYDPIPHAATSGIANAALANAVRQLQFPLGEKGVRIHVIAPGPVDTQRWWQLAQSEADKRGTSTDAILAGATASSSLNRLTTTEEVAWAVATLADPHAAALTGSTWLLDTGRRTASP
jgi:NAD(P)-dependent dehydrogenase (short-subunit alcohol dehydrogenase family)